MKTIDFQFLTDNYPDYNKIWPVFRSWFDKQSAMQSIRLNILVDDLQTIYSSSAMDIILALFYMVDNDML